MLAFVRSSVCVQACKRVYHLTTLAVNMLKIMQESSLAEQQLVFR